MSQRFGVGQVVNSDNFQVRALKCHLKGVAPDPPKAIYSNFSFHLPPPSKHKSFIGYIVRSEPVPCNYLELLARAIESLTTFLASDRKSTRLNSSHANISYAVFC